MQYRVTAKQPNSKMCLVCGLRNSLGLQASFFELEGEQLAALFTPRQEHQGYPGRLHGGIATAILDETIGRAILIRHPDEIWGVTAGLSVRFRQPAPLGQELRVIARITHETKRYFEGAGQILLPDGSVAVEASGKYFKFSLAKIADFDAVEQEWHVTNMDGDPSELDVPESKQATRR
jgi:uncharacterized protein (TIGR00369 family)